MKIISWNVNGIRACARKGLFDVDADIFCFQEIKATEEQVKEVFDKPLHHFIMPAQKKGYAGVSIHSKVKPVSARFGLGNEEFDNEGRVLTLEFADFYLLNVYFPHAHRELLRLDYKLRFN